MPSGYCGTFTDYARSEHSRPGVHRPTLSADDMVTRRWLVDELRAIGHTAEIDGIANVVGQSPAPGRKLLAGSHIESQNEAGWVGDSFLFILFN